MKIKVQCNCGTRFEFEVEPVNERMPMPIACPGCNTDATGLANEVIRAQLAPAKPAPTPAAPAPAIPALKIPTTSPAPQAPSTPAAASAPASPSIPAVRLPTPPAASPAPAAAPSIPAQPATPAPAPQPVVAAAAAPAPAAAPVSPPQGGGLRINKPAVAHTAPSAPQPAQAEAAGGGANKCPKHPTEDPVETCRVCNKPMCKKCMEMFGYVCSVYCRNQANARKMNIPVYAHQKSVVHEKSEGKARVITYAVVGLIFLLLGGWIWFEWWGSAPKVVYRIKFAKKESRGLHHLIGPGELLSIKDKQMTLFDVAQQKQIWATPIKTESAAPVVEEKPTVAGKTNNGIKIRATDKDAVKAEVASKVVKEKLPAATNDEDSSSSMSSDDDDDYFSYRDDLNIKEVIPTETDIWILFHDRLAQFDRKTGSAKQDIAFKRQVIHVSHDQNGILAVSMPDKNHRVLTQIALPSGTVQTEEIDLTPAKPKANDKTKKPATTVAKKTATPVTNQPLANSEDLDELDYFSSRDSDFISAGANVLELKTKLLERKVEVREAMKTKTTSILDSGNMNASKSLDAAEELLNDMQRQDTGSKVTEDVSRYEVTVHRWLAKGIPDWTGEIIGPPTIYTLKTVDVVAGGRSIIVLDKNNKKLWDSKLTFPVGKRSSFSFDFNDSDLPCLETSDTLYFADQGMLTSFDLSTGAVRWRVTSVGISKIQLDEKGDVYLTTTTATADTIQYSKQVNLKNRPEPVIMKIDAKTGKKLWEVVKIGEELLISGKYIYAGKVSTMMVALRLEDGPDYHYNFYRLKPSSGKVDWNYFQTKPGSHAEVNKNWILIQFRDEIQVLKFLSF